jgi:hypothetical protein
MTRSAHALRNAWRDQLDLFDDVVDTSVDGAVHDSARAVHDDVKPVYRGAEVVHDPVDGEARVAASVASTNDDAHANDAVDDAKKNSARLAIELRKGTKRRRNVEGVLRGDTLVVTYPPRLGQAAAMEIAVELRGRMERRLARERIDLPARARRLARALGLPRPRSVEWSDRQQQRWGSCTPSDGTIRLSSRLADYPNWVLDYVIVHELAHLAHADHGPAFRALVAQYPMAERATGFLIAKGYELD